MFVVSVLLAVMLVRSSPAETASGPSLPVSLDSVQTAEVADHPPLSDQEFQIQRLRGVNVGEKHPPYAGWCTQADFKELSAWGFNSIRLLMIWAAIEPAPGTYDEEYLDIIDERIRWAKEAGLWVVLDMHQDLYGPRIPGGDGAPEWATLDEGRPHFFPGGLWSMAYYTSPMVQTSFDSFWANSPGPGGVGLQDRYAAMWKHVAQRYANDAAVIGYDLMNEPFIGSKVRDVQTAIAPILAPHLGLNAATPIEAMLGILGKSERIIEAMGKPEVYHAVLDAGSPVFQEFERSAVQPMYQRVTDAIREVDRSHWIFIEPSVSANSGFRSAIQPVKGRDGKPDRLQVFAPHAYDLVTETSMADQVSAERLILIIGELRKHADQIGLPLYIGEWGAYPGSRNIGNAAHEMMDFLDDARAGHAYWAYHRGFDKTGFFKDLSRSVSRQIR